MLLLLSAGCSKDDGPVAPVIPPDVDLITILCNPLAPAPSETATLTAQVAGEGGSTAFQWSVSGGSLIDNGGITAHWQVPEELGVYEVQVIARIQSASDTMTKYILVRNFEKVETGVRFSYKPQFISGGLRFIGSPIPSTVRQFYGYHAYRWSSGGSTILTTNSNPPISGGYEFIFGDVGVMASVVTGGVEFLRQQQMNIIGFPTIGANVFVTNNDAGGSFSRKNQHIHPSASIEWDMVVWQGNIVGIADDGTKDFINIYYRSGTTPIQKLTANRDSIFLYGTWIYSYYRNIKPLFSPDLSTIVYFVDSTGTYEPCVIPIQGTEPLVDQRRAFMVDSRRGIFYYAGVRISESTVFQWIPGSTTQLMFVDGGGKLCLLDLAGETVQVLGEEVTECAISENGTIAAIADDGVYIGTLGGDPKLVFSREVDSDDLFGIAWSPGVENQRVVFRMVRKGAASDESFSAFVMYSVDDDRWYFASPRIPAGSEPAFSDYTWKRAAFEPDGTGFIISVPVPSGGGGANLYKSS
jgi:hypothetical protein